MRRLHWIRSWLSNGRRRVGWYWYAPSSPLLMVVCLQPASTKICLAYRSYRCLRSWHWSCDWPLWRWWWRGNSGLYVILPLWFFFHRKPQPRGLRTIWRIRQLWNGKLSKKLLGDSQFETNPDARVDKVSMDDIDRFLVCLFWEFPLLMRWKDWFAWQIDLRNAQPHFEVFLVLIPCTFFKSTLKMLGKDCANSKVWKLCYIKYTLLWKGVLEHCKFWWMQRCYNKILKQIIKSETSEEVLLFFVVSEGVFIEKRYKRRKVKGISEIL